MKAEIITIGDEILIGQIVDTNSAWISERLNEIGLRVMSRISVGDDIAAISDTVTDALNSADVIIITGGLGPTKDDITKKTLADLFDCELVRDQWTDERNEQVLNARGVDYNELNRSQAMVPEHCTVLHNPNGTAPGMWFERGKSVIVALPGVPFEMKRILSEEVLPRLKQHFKLGKITHKTMVTFGIAESMLAEKIADWEDSLPDYLKLAYLPSPSGIRLRLSAYEKDEEHIESEMNSRFSELEKIIPDNVVGYGNVTIQSAVAQMLTRSGKTLAVAESCTGGYLSTLFTAMPGASAYFLSGIVSYSNGAKTDILRINSDDIERQGAVSQTVAEKMAVSVRHLSGSDYAISTTGIVGPEGGTPEKPVGTVWIAMAYQGGIISHKFIGGSLRDVNIERASATAINMLRLMLLEG